jgi:hypothetical protein
MANEKALAAMRKRRDTPFPLVKSDLVLDDVVVYVRALPFRESMQIRMDHPDDDKATAEARVLIRCLYDEKGELLFDPLDPEHLELVSTEKYADFWLDIGVALGTQTYPKASAQTSNS